MSSTSSIASPNAPLRRRVIGMYGLLGAFNIGAWVWAFIAFHGLHCC